MFLKLTLTQSLLKRTLLAILAGFFSAVAIKFFIKDADLLNSGVLGLVQGTSLFMPSEETRNIFYWGLYLILNIPLFIFGYFRIGRRYTIVSFCFIFSQAVSGIILSSINILNEFNFFYQEIGNDPSKFWTGDNLVTFMGLRILYLLTGSLFFGFWAAFSYVVGGSTGGTDIIAAYTSLKTKKSLSNFLFIIATSTLVLASLLAHVFYPISQSQQIDFQAFFVQLLMSVSESVIVITVINIIYPRHKKVTVQIYTTKSRQILRHFKKCKMENNFTSSIGHGSYLNKEITVLSTTIYLIEYPRVYHAIRKIDKNCFLSVLKTYAVAGRMHEHKWD